MELVREESTEGTISLPIPLQGIVDLYVSEHLPGYVLEKWWIGGAGSEVDLVFQVRRIQ